MWSATSTTAGGAMQRERWHGTLELLVAAPPPFALVLLPVTLAMATVGIYSLTATLLYGHFLFGIDLVVEQPLLFAASVVGTVLSFGALGLVFAVTFVRFRAAWALGNLFEYPVWLIGGFLVPLALLPGVGSPVLVGARADLGHERDPRVRRGWLAAERPGHLPWPRRRLCRRRHPRDGARAACRPRPGRALAVMTSVRVFFVGGQITYRALFYWLTPQIYIPGLIVAPIFQILLFAYIGRSAGLESDEFYVVGNALQYSAVPCLFAMTQMIGGERYQNTLSAILVSPAHRIPLFFGRVIPVVVNGAFVAAFALAAGTLILGVDIPLSAVPGLPGGDLRRRLLVHRPRPDQRGALAPHPRERRALERHLRVPADLHGREHSLGELPDWMSAISEVLPFTHAIEAARELADGASLGSVAGLIGTEVLLGLAYAALGYGVLRLMEVQSRRYATLERS